MQVASQMEMGKKKSTAMKEIRETQEGGRRRPSPGSLLTKPAFLVWPQEEVMDTCDQSKMAAHAFMSPPHGSPLMPLFGIEPQKRPHGNGGKKGKIPSIKISDKLRFVYCLHNNFKGYIMCKEFE